MKQEVITRVTLPTLHVDQERAFWALLPHKLKALRCGRRWGKTDYAKTWAGDGVIKGQPVGWFAPDYKIQSEAFNELVDMLAPVLARSSKTEGIIRTTTGGRIDFWTLDNERAGRSRKYEKIVIDEGAFTDDGTMMGIWEKSILPTLLDLDGEALVCSNTNGVLPENFFHNICTNEKYGFHQYHAPTHNNPYMPLRLPSETDAVYKARRAATLEKLKTDNHPLVYQQEYLAEFVDWSGVAFFALKNLLVNDAPIAAPTKCDAVYAIVDTATKTGRENDGTAVTYYALTKNAAAPLAILDWDYVQIEGALLETWLPQVFKNLEHFAKTCGARAGSLGAHIEDKSSGMVLIQQARRRGWKAQAIDSKLTSVGKDERAISVSGYVYRNMVKLCKTAFDKVVTYKQATRNHFVSQVTSFRIGDKDAAKRDDDCLDTFTYGIALGLGDAGGF